MAVMMVLMPEMVEKRPRVTPAMFLPPIFAGTTSVYVLRIYPPPHFVIIEGVFI
jgi:hypothetical protein